MNTNIHVYIQTGERVTRSEIKELIEKSGDEYFHERITSIDVKCGEFPEDSISGYAILKTYADPDGMLSEAQWYIDGSFVEEFGRRDNMVRAAINE